MRTFKAGADPCPLLGVKQTSAGLSPMSAFDSKQTFGPEDCRHAPPIGKNLGAKKVPITYRIEGKKRFAEIPNILHKSVDPLPTAHPSGEKHRPSS